MRVSLTGTLLSSHSTCADKYITHQRKNPSIPFGIEGLVWRTQEESNGCSKDEGNPTFSKSGAPSLWPSAAQRARKRAKFSIPEHVEFVGNWEVDDVERRVVELN